MIGKVKRVTVIIGTTSEPLSIDVDENLDTLRNILIEGNFIYESRRNKWRFVIPSSNTSEILISASGFVGKQFERNTPIKRCQNKKNEILMINIEAKPDLNGVITNVFSDRIIDVVVALNSKYSHQNKFPPQMLKNVRRNTDAYSSYDHVVVCEEDSVIQFDIGANVEWGFGLSIMTDKGIDIAKGLYVLHDRTTIRRFQDRARNINVVSAETPDITLSEAVDRQHITITVWELQLLSGVKSPEKPETKTFATFTRNARNRRVPVDEDAKVAHDDYKRAQLVPGGRSDDEFGTVDGIKEDTEQILGRIEIDFFVLKSREAARKAVSTRP